MLSSCLRVYHWDQSKTREGMVYGTKIRWLGLQNQIVNDSDFKMAEIKWRIWSDSKSDVKIWFLLNVDVKIKLKSTKFDFFKDKKDHFDTD